MWLKARDRLLDPGILEVVKWALMSSSQLRIFWHFQYRDNFKVNKNSVLKLLGHLFCLALMGVGEGE